MGRRDGAWPAAVTALWPLGLALAVNTLYRWMTIPAPGDRPPYSLILSPSASDRIAELLASNPLALLGPIELDTDRWAWTTTTLLPLYALEQALPPAAVYLVVTGICTGTLYVCGLVATRSVRFATILGLVAGLSTFLGYSFVYGNVMLGFLVIAWLAIAVTALLAYLRAERGEAVRLSVFLLALLPLVLSAEYWLNFAVPAILACGFATVWGRRHGDAGFARRSLIAGAVLAGAMAIYLPVRFMAAAPLVQPGFESESVVTYPHLLMMAEDMAVNYLTYLYMALSSVLPGFLVFSPSYAAYGPEVLAAEQNGYHDAYNHLIPISAMTSWRFVGGALVLGFFLLGWRWIRAAWTRADRRDLVPVALFLVIALGFVIYLPIKMRPFHLTAMLGYKALIASAAMMVLVAWAAFTAERWTPARWRRPALAGLAALIVLSAFTRPAAEIAGLEAVGLDGAGDPLVGMGDQP
ncbi:hypothetical protein [Hyphobacterium marinum]|uniref:Glycosyltransferase RgtA/B/C/D-like domain-containing protein n=1 Tax=Hyphobacterium marinum TaxID=3116574 RepID=A0ABU7LUD5_9PROT|nr:hypothetical protein [Hyphobacterium sp. Y6023]MEE2565163.1 hypothetical protein [Hyphobacterium sp. Y6023]